MFERLLDLNNLYEACTNSCKNVDWKESVQKYQIYALSNIMELRQSLIDGTYRQKPFYEFDLKERGKLRHIKSMHITDQCCIERGYDVWIGNLHLELLSC